MAEPSSKPWFPERIADALRGAKDFGKFREARVFKFLHLFSGPRDVIGEKLVEKGKKENLTVEVVSVDLKINHSIKDKKLAADLSKEQPYNTPSGADEGGRVRWSPQWLPVQHLYCGEMESLAGAPGTSAVRS